MTRNYQAGAERDCDIKLKGEERKSMKREDVKSIFDDATDEQINKILNIHSQDIGNAKKDYETIKEDLKKTNETIETMTKELNGLKESNASSEDWKKKFEKLEGEMLEEKRIAKEQKEAAEKEAEILDRFNRVCVDKDGNALEFIHDAIKADYIKKFGAELENKDNVGKADSEIFHTLTKDDGVSFKGVTAVNLHGGKETPGASSDGRTNILMRAMGIQGKGE